MSTLLPACRLHTSLTANVNFSLTQIVKKIKENKLTHTQKKRERNMFEKLCQKEKCIVTYILYVAFITFMTKEHEPYHILQKVITNRGSNPKVIKSSAFFTVEIKS